MKDRDIVFWMKFSHEWSLFVLGGFAVLVAVTVFANQYARRRRKAGAKERGPKIAAGALNLVMVPGVLFFVYSQGHFPCAAYVSMKTHCLSNLKSLASAQSLYATDHDGFFQTADDWPSRITTEHGLRGSEIHCPGVGGKVDYSLNQGVVLKNVGTIEDPRLVLLFEGTGETVCGKEGFDTSRHHGHPQVAFVDGSARTYSKAMEPMSWQDKP